MTGLRGLPGLLPLCAALCAPVGASARPLKPGLYNLNNTQEICLEPPTGSTAGTWYSPTRSGWQGLWVTTRNHVHIFGNYNSGAGNDSIDIQNKAGSWTEWTDDLSFFNVLNSVTFTSLGACPAARVFKPADTGNPSRR